MSIVKKTVSLSSELFDESRLISSNFSWVVEAALRDYLQHYRVQKAMQSFGKWESRDVDSVTLTNKLREENCNYA
jgi:hypothetical protein